MDTSFAYTEKGKGYFSSDEYVWINRIKKLQEEYPEQVRIIAQPENNDGCIYCQLPTSWFKLQPKRKSTMTDEQKAAASARMKAMNRRNVVRKLIVSSSGVTDDM